MIKLISYEFSDYYSTGDVVIEVNNTEYVLNRETLGDSKEAIELRKNLHSVTFTMEDDCCGWSESRKQHWVCYNTEDLQWRDDYDPEDHDDVTFMDDAQWYEYHFDMIACWLNESDAHDIIMTHIAQLVEVEKDNLIWKLKFGSTQVLKPGYLTKLYNAYKPDYDYAMLIGERDGNDYDESDILAVYDEYAIICKNRKDFTIMHVSRDYAEPVMTVDSYEDAVREIQELFETA